MKLTVLGTVSPYLTFDHNGPGFLVEDGEHKVLLDCGSGITRHLKFPYHLENLHVFISHFHRDHYNEIYNIQYASYVYHKQNKLVNPVEIHLPMVTFSRFEDIVDEEYAFAYYNRIFTELEGVEVGKLKVTFCLTAHSTESYAFKVTDGKHTIVYTSDLSFAAKDIIVAFAKDVDLLICDSSLLESYGFPAINRHITAKQAAVIAKEAGVKQLMLTHFWPEETLEKYEEEAKQVFKNVILAREKMVIDFDATDNEDDDQDIPIIKQEKQFNPDLWTPVGVKPVEIRDYIKPGESTGGFLPYQAPDDRYEVRGIMPKAPTYPECDYEDTKKGW